MERKRWYLTVNFKNALSICDDDTSNINFSIELPDLIIHIFNPAKIKILNNYEELKSYFTNTTVSNSDFWFLRNIVNTDKLIEIMRGIMRGAHFNYLLKSGNPLLIFFYKYLRYLYDKTLLTFYESYSWPQWSQKIINDKKATAIAELRMKSYPYFLISKELIEYVTKQINPELNQAIDLLKGIDYPNNVRWECRELELYKIKLSERREKDQFKTDIQIFLKTRILDT